MPANAPLALSPGSWYFGHHSNTPTFHPLRQLSPIPNMSNTPFTRPKVKYNPNRRLCCCDWVDKRVSGAIAVYKRQSRSSRSFGLRNEIWSFFGSWGFREGKEEIWWQSHDSCSTVLILLCCARLGCLNTKWLSIRSRVDLNNNNRDAIFHNAQVEEQLANEKHAEALARSPEDWQRIVSSKDVQMTQRDNEIAKLRAEKEA